MSGIDNAKAAQGYLPATQRPACRNCRLGEEQSGGERSDPKWERYGWKCKLGGFFVTAFASCDRHEAKFAPRIQMQAVGEEQMPS